jgi:hypothetical protein
VEEEVRDILRSAVNEGDLPGGLGSEIAALFAQNGIDFEILNFVGIESSPRPLTNNA